MSIQNHTQLVIIGAGPGGYRAAFLAADLGIDTVIIDPEEHPGGVCLYRGCVPTKALLHSVHQYREIQNSGTVGIDVEGVFPNIERIRAHKSHVISELTGSLDLLRARRGISHIRGYGQFTSSKTIRIARNDGIHEELSFEYAVLATGAVPQQLPHIPFDGSRVISSREALQLERIPESMLVVGAGFIGLELGSVYAGLGSRVTVAEQLPDIMPGADRDIVNEYLKSAGPMFQELKTLTSVTEVSPKNAGSRVQFTDSEGGTSYEDFDTILLTVGRKPNTASLALEQAGIHPDPQGFIPVDPQRRSSQGHIFAIGDLTGAPLLAHKAFHEAGVAVRTIVGEETLYDPTALPAVEYTDPEIAWTGLTEDQARHEGREIEIGRFPWSASPRAATLNRRDGLTKLIFEKGSSRLLGAGIVGRGAGELISELSLAVQFGATASDLQRVIHPHPSLAESILEAAEDLRGTSAHYHRSAWFMQES